MSGTSIIAYLILTLSVGYAFVYPKIEEISLLKEEQSKYEKSLEMTASIENKKNELLAEFNKISASDRKSIETFLPDSLNFVRLAYEVDAVASKYAISIDRVSSKDMGSSAGSSIAEAEPPKPYKTSTLGFSFVAPYPKFQSFIDDLEKSLRILDIKSLSITVQENGLYLYNIEFETYSFK